MSDPIIRALEHAPDALPTRRIAEAVQDALTNKRLQIKWRESLAEDVLSLPAVNRNSDE